MFSIYYKTDDNKIAKSNDMALLGNLVFGDIIWIDLNDPTGDEKRSVETFMKTEIQSRAQAEEIESTSRYYETDNAIFANTNFLISQPESYTYDPVSFMLSEGVLVTLHNSDLRTLNESGRRLLMNPRIAPTGYHLMVSILERRIDLDADMVEGVAKEIAHMSKQIGVNEKIDEEQLLDINQMQENTMLIRENIIDKQRVISSILKSDQFPSDLYPKLNLIIKDINSLINYTDFGFERLEYLQNTVLGLINIEQNKIIKIFTVATVIFAPPTLIASLYGMNFKFMPELDWKYGYAFALGLMIIVTILILWIFKAKKWL